LTRNAGHADFQVRDSCAASHQTVMFKTNPVIVQKSSQFKNVMPSGGARPNSGPKKGTKYAKRVYILPEKPRPIRYVEDNRVPKVRALDEMRKAAVLLHNLMVEGVNRLRVGSASPAEVSRLILDYLRAQREIAPYEDAKLVSIRVSGDRDNPVRVAHDIDLTRLSDEQLATLRPLLALTLVEQAVDATVIEADERTER
jgi:hypothetical protein